MLEVSVITRKSWHSHINKWMIERKISILCPICGWLKSYREIGKVDRTYSRLTERCFNPECSHPMPDVGRLLDQPIIRLSFTKRNKIRGEDQNYVRS